MALWEGGAVRRASAETRRPEAPLSTAGAEQGGGTGGGPGDGVGFKLLKRAPMSNILITLNNHFKNMNY